jgi:uncharacterized protein (TIGR03382 family)
MNICHQLGTVKVAPYGQMPMAKELQAQVFQFAAALYDPTRYRTADTYIRAVHQARYPNGGPGQGDLAMLTLASAGPATPIPVGNVDLATLIGQNIRIVGFGVTSENGGGGGTKRKATARLLRVDQSDMFASNSPSGTCYGDSGGPNFMMIGGVEHVVGTTSYGTSACGTGEDASGRTDTGYTWIQQYIAAHDPPSCSADDRCATGCPSPDPDCACAADGLCTSACTELDTDPDCDGCGADGVCRADCAVEDTDCAPPDDGGGGGGGGGSGSGSDGEPGDDDTGGVIVGGCTAAGDPPTGIGGALMLVALALVRRRRTR